MHIVILLLAVGLFIWAFGAKAKSFIAGCFIVCGTLFAMFAVFMLVLTFSPTAYQAATGKAPYSQVR